MDKMMQTLANIVVNSLPGIAVAIITLIIFWYLAKLSHSLIEKLAVKNTPQRQPVFHLLSTISKISIFVVGIITALGSAGVNVSALVASIGLSGLAISLASKDAFSNLLSGVLLLVYQPFKIGDLIEVNNIKGQVIKMSLRYTHLTQENKEILIPNASLLVHPIIIVNNKGKS